MAKQTLKEITVGSTIRQSKGQVSVDVDGRVTLMSINNGKYYCLSSTSTFLWQLIHEPRRIGEVCAVLAQEYDIEPQQCETEVLAHVGRLLAENLVEVVQVTASNLVTSP